MKHWEILGIEPTDDKRDIKRAYVKQLKVNNPEDNPQGFQRLREAYDTALENGQIFESQQVAELQVVEQQVVMPDSDTPEDEPIVNADENTKVKWQSSENVRVQTEQTEKIQQAMDDIKSSLLNNVNEAVKQCQQHCQDEYFQALDVRYRYEGELLKLLCDMKIFPLTLIGFMAKEFEWDLEMDRRAILHKNHFQGNDEYSKYFAMVFRAYLQEEIVDEIVTKYITDMDRTETTDEVEKILFSPYDEEKLAIFKTSVKHQRALALLYQYTKRWERTNEGLSPIPYETQQWLESNVFVDRESTYSYKEAQHQGQTARRSQRKSGNSGLFATLLLLALLVCGVLGKAVKDKMEIAEHGTILSR